jgi:hypothetical protein
MFGIASGTCHGSYVSNTTELGVSEAAGGSEVEGSVFRL